MTDTKTIYHKFDRWQNGQRIPDGHEIYRPSLIEILVDHSGTELHLKVDGEPYLHVTKIRHLKIRDINAILLDSQAGGPANITIIELDNPKTLQDRLKNILGQ